MLPDPVHLAKISPPVPSGCFPRKRLFRMLDRARRKPAVWICGPPGSGKTVLVSSYLSARGTRCLWYRMDETDRHAASFFFYLGIAARRATPRKRKPLPMLSPENLPVLPLFAHRYFEELYSRLGAGSVLVFDDYQKVPEDSGIHDVIRNGLSLLPEGINAMIISRSHPHRIFARKRAHGLLETIGWRELRLTLEETKGIARRRGKGKPDTEDIRRLVRRTDGWAAGLILLLEDEQRNSKGSPVPKGHAPEETFEYFGTEIFERLDGEAKTFLLKTAFLPRMTVQMAEKMTGRRSAGRVLSFLSRHNYFTEKRLEAFPVYEYHSLFREFLVARAESAFPPSEAARLRRSAAAIMEEAGDMEAAAALFREIADWKKFTRIIRIMAPSLASQGRNQVLADWIGSIPDKVGGADPWMEYWMGVSLLPLRPADSRESFEKAFRKFKRRSETAGALMSWSGIVDSIVYGSGDLKSLDRWFLVPDMLMKSRKAFPSQEIESQATCAMIKALSLRRPPFMDMETWAERAMDLSRSARDVQQRFSSLLNVAYYRFHNGDVREAALLLDSLRSLLRRPEIPPLPRLAFFWTDAACANMSGDYNRCLVAVSDGLSLAEATGIHVMDLLLLGHGALCSLHQGEPAEAKSFLRRMAAALPLAKPWGVSFYHYLAAWEALHRGDCASASFHSGKRLALSELVGNPWTDALARLQAAVISFQAGEAGRAEELLDSARHLGKESRMRFIDFASSLTGAYFSMRSGDGKAALERLRHGMRMGMENGYGGIYLGCPAMLESLAAKALEAGIESGYAADLVRNAGIVPGDEYRDVEDWPWPLKIYTLDRFGLVKDGKALRFSRKIQKKPLALLKALVALGGRDIPEERLTDILWPEAEGDLAHRSLTTTLGRLRLLLGNEKAIRIREGRLTLDNRYCWVDAWAFERILGKAERMEQKDGRQTEIGRILSMAIGLYRGPFLPGEQWALATRERLRSKFMRAVEEAGRVYERAGEWAEAIACYRRGLEVDPLAEGIHRRLIACHLRLGDNAEAMAAYRRCRASLSSGLGVAPSPETERLVAGIRSSS